MLSPGSFFLMLIIVIIFIKIVYFPDKIIGFPTMHSSQAYPQRKMIRLYLHPCFSALKKKRLRHFPRNDPIGNILLQQFFRRFGKRCPYYEAGKCILILMIQKFQLKACRHYHTGNAQSLPLPEQKRKHCAEALDLYIAVEPACVSEYDQ